MHNCSDDDRYTEESNVSRRSDQSDQSNQSNQSNQNQSHHSIKNHNHEFLSSTDYARDNEGQTHNHSIAGVTSRPIRYGRSHIHKIEVLTDTFDDHFHRIYYTTGRAIYLRNGKHIHLVKGETSRNDGHDHDFYFTTLIQDPTNVSENVTR